MEDNKTQTISLFGNTTAPTMDNDEKSRQLVEKLPSIEIMNVPDEEEPPSLYNICGVDVLSKKTVCIIAAQKKSGKTNFAGLLMSAAISPEHQVLGGAVRCNVDDMKILDIDTEQPLKDARRTLRRMMKTAGYNYDDQWHEHGIISLSVKDVDEQSRMPLIELAISESHPNMVIIDGSADLIRSINDEQEAKALMNWMDYLACKYDCVVVAMLHLNYGSSKIGGWAGTQANKKFTDSFILKKDKTNSLFTVEHEGRGECAPKLYFRIFCPMNDKIGWWQSLDQTLISELTDEDAEELSFRELMDAAPLPCSNTALVSWVMQVKRWASRSPANKLLRKCKKMKILNSRRQGRQSIWFRVTAAETQSQQLVLSDDSCLCVPPPIYS